MRLFFAIVVSAAALLAADPQSAKKPAPAPKAADGSKQTIPAGAVRTQDGDYRYTDAQGKQWIYHQTPWGWSRMEQSKDTEVKTSAGDSAAGIKATEDGDKVRFERLGPFGVWKWERQKSELNETEKAVLRKSRGEDASKPDAPRPDAPRPDASKQE